MRTCLPSLLLLLTACSFQGADPGEDGRAPPDSAVPDPDATDEPDPDAGCAARCDGNQLITCTAGVPNPPVACAVGCGTSGGPHCQEIVPSNGATRADLLNVTSGIAVAAGQTVTIDTDSGAITRSNGAAIRAAGPGLVNGIGFRTASQGGNGVPEIAIFSVAALSVAGASGMTDEGELSVIGSRSVVILAANAVTISGVVDVSAARGIGGQASAGPGGGTGATVAAPATGCAPGQPGNFVVGAHTGGGGGGNGTLGAAGGAGGAGNTTAGGTVTAELSACSGADLVPLEGGSGGGRGSTNPVTGGIVAAIGGGGGGAVQITSFVSITVSGATADLYAGGAGGDGIASDEGGGGAGAGGGILLEAPTVAISGGHVTANGGGGGSGKEALRGQNGLHEAVRAIGGAGTGMGDNTGRGGSGSIGTAAGQEATAGNGGTDGTGGGGGGAGVIRLNGVSAPTVTGGAVVSPAPSVGTLAVQ